MENDNYSFLMYAFLSYIKISLPPFVLLRFLMSALSLVCFAIPAFIRSFVMLSFIYCVLRCLLLLEVYDAYVPIIQEALRCLFFFFFLIFPVDSRVILSQHRGQDSSGAADRLRQRAGSRGRPGSRLCCTYLCPGRQMNLRPPRRPPPPPFITTPRPQSS